tara:strand:+ start:464 stop:988 length:525 start_codon:yes stop_codon:yes gene_type:complete
MPIIIKIVEEPSIEKIHLKAKKTIDGNIIIVDHPEVDIMILPSQKKVVALPKEELDDEIHETQARLFKFLNLNGVIAYDSIQAGNLFMSMEASYPEAKEGDSIQYILFAISKFFEEDLPFYVDQKDFEAEVERNLLEPEIDEYTEFDPDRYHSDRKGTLRPGGPAYGINSIYRI